MNKVAAKVVITSDDSDMTITVTCTQHSETNMTINTVFDPPVENDGSNESDVQGFLFDVLMHGLLSEKIEKEGI